MSIGNALKDKRKELGLTQKQLASHLLVSDTAVGNWEKGIREPSLDMIKKIAQFYDISTDDILFYEESQSYDKSTQKRIISIYRYLSNDGKNKLLERCEELMQLDKKR